MKSLICTSSIRAITSAVAVSALTLSTAFAATYVPHENNFFSNDATTRGTVGTQVAPTDARMSKAVDAMQTSPAKKAMMIANSQSIQRIEGAAQ